MCGKAYDLDDCGLAQCRISLMSGNMPLRFFTNRNRCTKRNKEKISEQQEAELLSKIKQKYDEQVSPIMQQRVFGPML